MVSESNHYDTLDVNPQATSTEIKQAYRRLAKLFHPDSNSNTVNTEKIIQINAAYEIIGDPQRRHSYDQKLRERNPQASSSQSQERHDEVQRKYRRYRGTNQNIDTQISQWLQEVYKPVNQLINPILKELNSQIDQLAADPFDDELMEEFQKYLEDSRHHLNLAQTAFRSQPNPPHVAGVAASLYYCINQLGDGIEELHRFTLNYDDYYLHVGQELFRIAKKLRYDAQYALKDISC